MEKTELYSYFRNELLKVYSPQEASAVTRKYFEDHNELGKITTGFISFDLSLKIEQDLNRLLNHEPVQYVLGFEYFRGRKFNVNHNVLIPRPETEELVDLIISQNPSFSGSILDLGTGSGCIAITLKSALSQANVTATDISREAISTAIENARLNNAEITYIIDDILNTALDDNLKFDIIVSNPPYIPCEQFKDIEKHVLHEPYIALFTGNNDALKYYKSICYISKKHLSVDGSVYLEINGNYGNETLEIYKIAGFKSCSLFKDMSGHDRFIHLKI